MVLEKLHQESELESLTLDDLRAYFFASYPALKRQEADGFNAIFDRIASTDLSDTVLDLCLEQHIERAKAHELANIAFEVSEGKHDSSKLSEAIKTYTEQGVESPLSEVIFVTDSLEELYGQTFAQPGVKWRLKTLRKMMGSLRGGYMGFIFTRPNVGKTTMLASEGSFIAPQLDGDYIHFNNEESGSTIKIRYMQAALGITVDQLFADREGNEKKYLEATANKIRVYDSPVITKQRVEEICERQKPKFIVLDSIDKIKGFEEDRDDLVYKQIYQWARELAKTYGPVIGVCHASVSAERKRWLEMDDVAYAKTAKQGEADWILGIGATYTPGQEFIRHLHLSKNKLMPDKDMDEQFRHGKLDVRIFPEIAQYDDILNWD